ncbi:hypothetical protein R1sor_018217 [Riccia sorocarpa]|uniref:Uncharacterized protein n=1 Tax=Riccia sorocarpa TaxID=122646 RepID=A0ABD3ICM4_9MARC
MNDPEGSYYFPDRREVVPDGKLNYPEGGWYHPDDKRNLLDGEENIISRSMYLHGQPWEEQESHNKAAQPLNRGVTKFGNGLGILQGIGKKRTFVERIDQACVNYKSLPSQRQSIRILKIRSESNSVVGSQRKGVATQVRGRVVSKKETDRSKSEAGSFYRVKLSTGRRSIRDCSRENPQPVWDYSRERFYYQSGAVDTKNSEMGRKPTASKAVEEAEDTTLPENLMYASEKLVAGQKTFGCYSKKFERIEWEDEERANYWLNQFGALTALKLTHIEPDLIAKLVNAYNPVSNRIDLMGFEDVLCESMISDCFNLPSEGIAVSRNPELPHEWISHCYPEYAVPENTKKEYYVAARCVDPEWKNKISWVLRHVLGRAEGREIPKGVLAAMIQAEVEGEVVNWAAIVFERIRGELRRLKAIRKGDHLKCEAGPLLTMVAEDVAY